MAVILKDMAKKNPKGHEGFNREFIHHGWIPIEILMISERKRHQESLTGNDPLPLKGQSDRIDFFNLSHRICYQKLILHQRIQLAY